MSGAGQWASLGDFFAMGGYGLYVWGSYAVFAIAMLWEALAAKRAHHKALDEVMKQR